MLTEIRSRKPCHWPAMVRVPRICAQRVSVSPDNPERRIRACANWPDRLGYRAQKTRFCRRPSTAAKAFAPCGHAGRPACGDLRSSCRLPALDLGSAARPGPSSQGVSRDCPAQTRRREEPKIIAPGLSRAAGPGGGPTRACLTVRARGPAARQAWCAVAGGRVRRWWRWRRGGRRACGPGARPRPRRPGRPPGRSR
jgi:hypothetical protein